MLPVQRTTYSQQRGVSFTRLSIAFLTCGLSLPLLGVRRRRRTTVRSYGHA